MCFPVAVWEFHTVNSASGMSIADKLQKKLAVHGFAIWWMIFWTNWYVLLGILHNILITFSLSAIWQSNQSALALNDGEIIAITRLEWRIVRSWIQAPGHRQAGAHQRAWEGRTGVGGGVPEGSLDYEGSKTGPLFSKWNRSSHSF